MCFSNEVIKELTRSEISRGTGFSYVNLPQLWYYLQMTVNPDHLFHFLLSSLLKSVVWFGTLKAVEERIQGLFSRILQVIEMCSDDPEPRSFFSLLFLSSLMRFVVWFGTLKAVERMHGLFYVILLSSRNSQNIFK